MQGFALNGATVNLDALWLFVLLVVRLIPLFFMLPGVGTEQVPEQFRMYLILIIAFVCSISLPGIPMAIDFATILLSILTEFAIGMVLGLFPALALSGLSVAGQVVAGVIGLGQANMIDPSLGGNVSVLARFNVLLGMIVFLLLDGHHVLLKASTLNLGTLRLGDNFSLTPATVLLGDTFSSSFELAIAVSSPILIATLISQFILGLITKFVPQVNIFIISLPLSIFMGFYIIAFTVEPFSEHVAEELALLEEHVALVISGS